jgi:hypothetical protein
MQSNERLIQYQCQKEGTLFYYQTGVVNPSGIVERCPVCGSKRVDRTGREFPPVEEHRPMDPPGLPAFLDAYLTAALWADLPWDDTDSPMPPSFPPPPPPGEFDPTPYLPHLSPQFRSQAEADCRTFLALPGVLAVVTEHPDPLPGAPQGTIRLAGADFWLTRQCHGSGFGDGDYWNDSQAELLTAAAHTFPELYVTVAHDGLIYANR